MPETPEVRAADPVAYWRAIVVRRRTQMEGAYERAGITQNDYWGARAKHYRAALHDRIGEDPFLRRVRRLVSPATSVLDVGAGTGRHTLALAPHVARVTAVDPSEAMLEFLREDVVAGGLNDVDIVEGEWLSTAVDAADVVICSHVLYPIDDVVPFLAKLDASARERVFVYLRADPLPTDFGLWSDFHGEPLQAQPGYLDAVNVLASMGILADVEVVQHRFTWTFANIDEALPQVRGSLCLRPDDAEADARLRELLSERLVAWPDGRVGPRVAQARSAIVSWAPQGRV